jgi:hypothetical protein
MQKWLGNFPTMGQQSTYRKYSSLLVNVPIPSSEKVLKVIEAECDKNSGRELDGLIVLTSENFYFLSNKELISISYDQINDITVKPDGKDKNEYHLTLRIGRSNRNFDDIKKNDDSDELFEILEAKIVHPEREVLTTVSYDFEKFLHAERLEELRKDNVKITSFLMKRDNMGFSKNGERLLREKHPNAQFIGEGIFNSNKDKTKQGNFIVVDKVVWLYEYDDKKRIAKKILFWPFLLFTGAAIDHFAIKTEVGIPDKGTLVVKSKGKEFIKFLEIENINYYLKVRKWYQKILGFRTGKTWKKTIASLTYSFVLLFLLIAIFAEEPEHVSKGKVNESAETAATTLKDKEGTNQNTEKAAAEKAAAEKAAAEKAAAEKAAAEKAAAEKAAAEKAAAEKAAAEKAAAEKAAAEKAAAEKAAAEKAAAEKAAAEKVAAEKAAAEKAAAEKAAAANVYYKNCDAVRAAGAAPIRKGQPGYAKHLDRDGDGIACDR